MGTDQHVKLMKITFFIIIFHLTSFPEQWLPQSADTENVGTFVQVKTKPSLTAVKAERNDFSLPVHIWVAFESVNFYHIYSVYPDQKSWWTVFTLLLIPDADAVQNINGWQNENWACNDFICGQYHIIQYGRPKWWFYHKRKLQQFLCFLKLLNGDKWSECRKLLSQRKLILSNILFSGRAKLNSSSG